MHNIDAETALENERLREALEKIMEGWETSAYKIAHQALGGESND